MSDLNKIHNTKSIKFHQPTISQKDYILNGYIEGMDNIRKLKIESSLKTPSTNESYVNPKSEKSVLFKSLINGFNRTHYKNLSQYFDKKEENDTFYARFEKYNVKKEENDQKLKEQDKETSNDIIFRELLEKYKTFGYKIPDMNISKNIFKASSLLMENNKLADYLNFADKKDVYNHELAFLTRLQRYINREVAYKTDLQAQKQGINTLDTIVKENNFNTLNQAKQEFENNLKEVQELREKIDNNLIEEASNIDTLKLNYYGNTCDSGGGWSSTRKSLVNNNLNSSSRSSKVFHKSYNSHHGIILKKSGFKFKPKNVKDNSYGNNKNTNNNRTASSPYKKLSIHKDNNEVLSGFHKSKGSNSFILSSDRSNSNMINKFEEQNSIRKGSIIMNQNNQISKSKDKENISQFNSTNNTNFQTKSEFNINIQHNKNQNTQNPVKYKKINNYNNSGNTGNSSKGSNTNKNYNKFNTTYTSNLSSISNRTTNNNLGANNNQNIKGLTGNYNKTNYNKFRINNNTGNTSGKLISNYHNNNHKHNNRKKLLNLNRPSSPSPSRSRSKSNSPKSRKIRENNNTAVILHIKKKTTCLTNVSSHSNVNTNSNIEAKNDTNTTINNNLNNNSNNSNNNPTENKPPKKKLVFKMQKTGNFKTSNFNNTTRLNFNLFIEVKKEERKENMVEIYKFLKCKKYDDCTDIILKYFEKFHKDEYERLTNKSQNYKAEDLIKNFHRIKAKVEDYDLMQRYNDFCEKYGLLDLNMNQIKKVREIDNQIKNLDKVFVKTLLTKKKENND